MIASIPFSSAKRVTRKAVNTGKLRHQIAGSHKAGMVLALAAKSGNRERYDPPNPKVKTMHEEDEEEVARERDGVPFKEVRDWTYDDDKGPDYVDCRARMDSQVQESGYNNVSHSIAAISSHCQFR